MESGDGETRPRGRVYIDSPHRFLVRQHLAVLAYVKSYHATSNCNSCMDDTVAMYVWLGDMYVSTRTKKNTATARRKENVAVRHDAVVSNITRAMI
jgi:hypothetical protein